MLENFSSLLCELIHKMRSNKLQSFQKSMVCIFHSTILIFDAEYIKSTQAFFYEWFELNFTAQFCLKLKWKLKVPLKNQFESMKHCSEMKITKNQLYSLPKYWLNNSSRHIKHRNQFETAQKTHKNQLFFSKSFLFRHIFAMH